MSDIKTMEKKILNSWTEKYRPQTINELVLEPEIKSMLQRWIDSNEINNICLYSGPGTGKSSIVNVLVKTLNPIILRVDGSKDTSINYIRENVHEFANSGRLDKSKIKLIILEESDRISAEGQDSLKSLLETSNRYCRYIFVTNRIDNLSDPIKSRCTPIYIKPPIKEVAIKVENILKSENVKYDKVALAHIIKKYYPDIRRTINECYNIYMAYGEITKEYVNSSPSTYYDIFDRIFVKNISIKEIVDILKKTMYDENEIYSSLAQYCIDKFESSDMVIAIAEKISQDIFDKDLKLLSTFLLCKEIVNSM